MLTDYIVHCPHVGCGWHGPLFPRGQGHDFSPTTARHEVVFECPRCRGEWRAEVVGDDVQPLSQESLVTH